MTLPEIQRRIRDVKQGYEKLTWGQAEAETTLKFRAQNLLEEAFGADHNPLLTTFRALQKPQTFVGFDGSPASVADWADRRMKMIAVLTTSEEKLEIRMTPTRPTIAGGSYSRRVFVAHGRDKGAREMVARFLERIGFEPVILEDQANQGKTIIEKFEQYSDVGFAVVLLTPDDATVGPVPVARARQNVIFELGFFTAKLGRSRVAVINFGGPELEMPSDYSGVVYYIADRYGGWQQGIAKELVAAGYQVDGNRLIAPS